MKASASEQLAVLTALQKLVKERLDEVRSTADHELLESYEDDGTTKRALKVGGIKVGDHMVVLTSGTWTVTDREAFEDFALAYGFATARKSVRPECMHRAVCLLEDIDPSLLTQEVAVDAKWEALVTNSAGTPTLLDSGEIVPGLTLAPQRVKCTQVRGCKPRDIIPIVQQLGGVDALLLGEPQTIHATAEEVGNAQD